MKEVIERAYDTINEGIDLLEKELEYRPQKLLGFTMFPERLTGMISTALTIGFGLITSSMA